MSSSGSGNQLRLRQSLATNEESPERKPREPRVEYESPPKVRAVLDPAQGQTIHAQQHEILSWKQEATIQGEKIAAMEQKMMEMMNFFTVKQEQQEQEKMAMYQEVQRLRHENEFMRNQDQRRELAPNHQVNNALTSNDIKLTLDKFSGKELYPGLGSGFEEWCDRFVRKVMNAEERIGKRWPEATKVERLGDFLEGTAKQEYEKCLKKTHREMGNNITVHDIIQELKIYFGKRISNGKLISLLRQEKQKWRTWQQHLLYLRHLNDLAGGHHDDLVLENIVKYAKPEHRIVLLARMRTDAEDQLQEAARLVDFIETELEDQPTRYPKHYQPKTRNPESNQMTREEMRKNGTCFNCNQKGHRAYECPSKKKKDEPPVYQGMIEEESKMMAIEPAGDKIEWLLDSGATEHFVNDARWLHDAKPSDAKARVANGATVDIKWKGTVIIETTVRGSRQRIALSDVSFVPSAPRNLLSIGRLINKGFKVNLEPKDACIIHEKTGNTVMELKRFHTLWTVQTKAIKKPGSEASMVMGTMDVDTLANFHKRLRHIGYDKIVEMARDPDNNMKICNFDRPTCNDCARGKQTRNPQPKIDSGTSAPTDIPGGVICSDIKGPMNKDRFGNRYMISFIDVYSNFNKIYMAPAKNEAAKKFMEFVPYFERQFGAKVKTLRTDGGAEYQNVEDYCMKMGIERQTSQPYTPASNGRAERFNRTITEMARTNLKASGLPESFWSDALLDASKTLNMIPTNGNDKKMSPNQVLTGKTSDTKGMLPFGSTCTVHVNNEKKPRSTWKARALQGIILGMSTRIKGYKVYIPKSNKVMVSKDIRNVSDPTTSQEEEPVPEGYSWNFNVESIEEPRSYNQAVNGKNGDKWREAINQELKALEKNGTFELKELPPGKNTVGCKWVFKVKKNQDGSIERYKARLVAQGFSQRLHEDYEQTFAPVMSIPTLFLLINMARKWGVPIGHGDIPNAYVRATLKEDIYMDVPQGYETEGVSNERQKLKLLKTLYGLKQSGREWNQLLHSKLVNINFKQCMTDTCLYYRQVEGKKQLIGIYVDDLIVVSQEPSSNSKIFTELKELEVKDLGEASKVLGIGFEKTPTGLGLHQQPMIEELAKTFKVDDAKPEYVPMRVNPDSEQRNDPLPTDKKGFMCLQTYQKLIGSLLWICRCTRPDISYAVHQLSRHTHDATVSDWKKAKKVLTYLNTTKTLRLDMSEATNIDQVRIEGYCDADWANDKDRKSITGMIIKFEGNPLSWGTKKQTLVATSTMEAEFVAATSTIQDMVWINNILEECDIEMERPTKIYVDNQAAIAQLQDESSSCKTKHLDIKLKYVKEHVKNKTIEPEYVDTKNQHADIFTKALQRPTLEYLREMIGLKDNISIEAHEGVLKAKQ